LDYRSVVSREQCRRILAAAVAMHDAFAGEEIDGLWPLGQRLVLFSSRTMEPFRDTGNPLPVSCLDGWERFATVAPPDVVELVSAVHDRPEVLAAPLADRGGRTLLHGDYWVPNMAPDADRVVLIDWGLATSGPPVVEFASFLVGCSDQIRASRDDILDDLRHLWGARHDEKLLRLGLAVGVVEMGWNLALQATQERGADDEALRWWVAAARRAVDTGLIG
jgi:aminoglycoside phosphotransferase (APT) family kinase protein